MTTTHAHEAAHLQPHPEGGLYCAVCGERPDPVQQALSLYRAAVDEVRRAEHVKQKAARALYEARKAAGDQEASPYTVPADGPLPSHALHARIAYVEEPTKDGRVIAPGAVDWQFGQRIPVTAEFEGGNVIGHAIPSHVDPSGAVMATVYVDRDLLEAHPLGISFGVGLDSIEADVNQTTQAMTIKSGRLRQIAAQAPQKAAWPGCVVRGG